MEKGVAGLFLGDCLDVRTIKNELESLINE